MVKDMNNKEVNNIRVAKNEAEYLNILEDIGNKITFKAYNIEEMFVSPTYSRK